MHGIGLRRSPLWRIRAEQPRVKRAISVRHGYDGIPPRSFPRGALQGPSQRLVPTQALEAGTDRARVGGIREPCGAAPELAKSWNVGEQQRTTGRRGLEHGEPERFVAGRSREDGGALHFADDRLARERAEHLQATRMEPTLDSVLAPHRPSDPD